MVPDSVSLSFYGYVRTSLLRKCSLKYLKKSDVSNFQMVKS